MGRTLASALALLMVGCVADPTPTLEGDTVDGAQPDAVSDGVVDARLDVGIVDARALAPDARAPDSAVDPCDEPGATPPCPEGTHYDPDDTCSALDLEWGCEAFEWCGLRYTCPRDRSDLSRVCGGWDLGPPGDCAPGDGPRCRTVVVEGLGPVQCFDPRCVDETRVEQGACPDIPGARHCYPNEVGCDADTELVWCGVRFPGCVVDELDCDGLPQCPEGRFDALELWCPPHDEQICDVASVCREGDQRCETHVTCGQPIACLEDACRGLPPLDCALLGAEPEPDHPCPEREDDAGFFCFVENDCGRSVRCLLHEQP